MMLLCWLRQCIAVAIHCRFVVPASLPLKSHMDQGIIFLIFMTNSEKKAGLIINRGKPTFQASAMQAYVVTPPVDLSIVYRVDMARLDFNGRLRLAY